ncbi:hypothetical protein NL108_010466, partial [Boleophthalmus pectinirostris]
ALFVYDGISNKLRLADSGAGGVSELASKFHISQPQYGLCRLGSPESGSPRSAMIIWMGQEVDDYRRTECASHIPAIKNFFKEVHVFLKAEKAEEVTEERIRAELSKAQTNASTQWLRRSSQSSLDRKDVVGTNYRKTNAAMEMRLANRDSFWARAEREEEERKEEERRRAADERRRLERERALKEKQDAEERDRKMNEKLKMIEEQRRKAAEQEEEERRKEKLKWEQQQREHEEEMRARLKRSESIEKAAEAAALVSQRTMNPREFFRQLSSSSSQSPTSPSRSGKPFRRYQRSLTDTAFIFSKAEESTASSPRSSPLVSPFSRAPPSFNRATSPPTSPVFHPSTSPQRTTLSPPLSPLRPAPPSSALPSVPLANIQVRGRPRSPSEPSAPPASPTLISTVGPSSDEAVPGSPPNVTEQNTFSFESSTTPPAPRASLPDQPISAAELASEISYKVQTVLVEEDEEEEEDVKEKEDTQPKREPQPDPEEPVGGNETRTQLEQAETIEEEEVKEEKAEPQNPTKPEETSAEEEQVQTEEEENTETEVKEAEEQTEQIMEKELVHVTSEEQEIEDMVTEEVSDQSESNEPALLTQHKDSSEIIGKLNHSLSPSDPELDSPELAVYCNVQEEDDDDDEDDVCIQKYITVSENGEEVLAEPQMCVRALYDYQA